MPKKSNPRRPTSSAPLTFGEAVNNYLAQGGEAQFIIKIEPQIGSNTPIDEIGDVQIDRLIKERYSHLKENTAHRQVRSPIRTVLNLAMGTGRRKGPGRPPVRWLTPDEVERLIDAASSPESIGLRDPSRWTLSKIAFMLGTGAVPGEVISIDAKAYDRNAGTWDLPGVTSIVVPRTILPPARASDLIGLPPLSGRGFLAPNGESYVIRHKGGGQMAEAFSKVRQAAGLEKEVTPATLRKTWAVWFYAQTQSLPALIGLGGWKGPRSAKPYTSLGDADLAQWLHQSGWDFRDSANRYLREQEKT